MELKSIIGLTGRGRAVSAGSAREMLSRRRGAGVLLGGCSSSSLCGGGPWCRLREENPCIFRVNKRKLSDFSRLTKLG